MGEGVHWCAYDSILSMCKGDHDLSYGVTLKE